MMTCKRQVPRATSRASRTGFQPVEYRTPAPARCLCHPARGPRGFTLVEMMVVSAVSLMLMLGGVQIYRSCLQVYRNAQGTTEIFETAKLIDRDMRDYLGHVVALKGNWISPKGRLIPGLPNATENDIDRYYLVSRGGSPRKQDAYKRDSAVEVLFSGAQWPRSNIYLNNKSTADDYKANYGYARRYGDSRPYYWYGEYTDYPGLKGWWMPAFFARRDGTDPDVLKADDIMAGGWGWPRPDYRLSANADKMGGGGGMSEGYEAGDTPLVSCWFYAENRKFNSPYTMALDNANIILVSLKFSVTTDTGRQETQLSVLHHHVVGFDVAPEGLVKADQSYANMLRGIKIIPYYLDISGNLVPMGDAELGWKESGGPDNTAGGKMPRCFDVKYTLRNPGSFQKHKFALRIYQFSNPQ